MLLLLKAHLLSFRRFSNPHHVTFVQLFEFYEFHISLSLSLSLSLPGLAGFIAAKDNGGGGDNWSYKMCKAPVKSSSPTSRHQTFYRPDALPVTQPTVSQHLKGNEFHILTVKSRWLNCSKPATVKLRSSSRVRIHGIKRMSISAVCRQQHDKMPLVMVLRAVCVCQYVKIM